MQARKLNYNLSQIRKMLSFDNTLAELYKETQKGDFLYKAELANGREITFFVPNEKTFIGKNKDRMKTLEPARLLIDYIIIK